LASSDVVGKRLSLGGLVNKVDEGLDLEHVIGRLLRTRRDNSMFSDQSLDVHISQSHCHLFHAPLESNLIEHASSSGVTSLHLNLDVGLGISNRFADLSKNRFSL
jgi:hypothetical protein